MRRDKVIRHFGGSKAEVARVLGIRPVCISKWREVIPETCALRLHLLTGEKLQYDADLYDKLKKRNPVPYDPERAMKQRRHGNGRKHAA